MQEEKKVNDNCKLFIQPEWSKFDEIKKPSGSITLEFSGNKAINLSVENIEVFLTDIGDPWLTAKKPNHDNA